MKLVFLGANVKVSQVTPRVGVWIETWITRELRKGSSVTPRVGVWIETQDKVMSQKAVTGHSPRGSVD